MKNKTRIYLTLGLVIFVVAVTAFNVFGPAAAIRASVSHTSVSELPQARQQSKFTHAVPQDFPVTLRKPEKPATRPLVSEGVVEGRVASAEDGKGIPGAHLTFARAGESAEVEGAPDGTFRFVPRQAGRWLLAAASASGYLPFAPEWGWSPVQFEVKQGEVLLGLSISLTPAQEYQGLVLDPAGHPVAEAEVRVLGGGMGGASLLPVQGIVRSDQAGIFHFLAPDDALVEARHPGFGTSRARVDFSARASRRVTVHMKLSGDSALSIEGNVEDSQGSPVAGAVVSGIHDQSRTDAPASATSDPLGHFRLDDLAAGFWDLTASLPGSAPAFARATAGATGLRLRLQKGGRLVGHVSDRGTGKPVPAFTVLLDSKEHRSLASIAGTGDYTLSDLAPGPAVVRVVALGHAPSPERRIIIPGPGAPPATADFELTGGGRLIGVIQERGTSRPIPGAHIEAEGVPDLQVIPVRTEGRTDSDGRFELSGLAEQVTGLFAWAPGFHARIISGLRIPESETRGPVTIELSALAPGEDPGVELVGIGAVLEKGDSSLRIVSVVQTGGAAEAGLLAGDEVVEIDGVSVAPLTLNEAIPLIRGPEGSTVAIAIIRTVGGQRVAALVQVPRRLVRR